MGHSAEAPLLRLWRLRDRAGLPLGSWTLPLLVVFSPLEDFNIAILVGDSPAGQVLVEGAVGLECALILVWLWALAMQRNPMRPCAWWQPAALGATACAAVAAVATTLHPGSLGSHAASFGVVSCANGRNCSLFSRLMMSSHGEVALHVWPHVSQYARCCTLRRMGSPHGVPMRVQGLVLLLFVLGQIKLNSAHCAAQLPPASPSSALLLLLLLRVSAASEGAK
eukprot:SAG11_NODE_3395_length_2473_cov_1.835720_2_plen_224_part_00